MAALCAGAACGPERDCEGGDGGLGSCCRSDAECPAPYRCFSQVPGGLCSLECVGAGSCPEGAHCIEVQWPSGAVLGRLCLPGCRNQADCPADLACVETAAGGLWVCFPRL